jgi:phospholipid/cholesterol/gamma-HCH transport system substrate-binding protein
VKISRYIKVALFFIILGGAGAAYIVLSADGISNFNTVPYQVTLSDATGLSTRSKVYLAGVPVGKVQAIQLEGTTARIRIGLLKGVEVRENASISRKASSILGTSVLNLDPGSEPFPAIPPGGVIQPESGTDINALMGTVSGLGTQIADILKEFQTNQMQLLAISLETFNSISGKIDERMSEDMDHISRILDSAARITERTERLIASNERNVGASMEEIRLAAGNIRQISTEIANGRGNIGQAIYDDKLYEGLLSTVQETEKTVVKLQGVIDSAQGVVDGAGEFIGKASGLGVMVDSNVNYGFTRDTVRAGASLRLEPASGDRWYRLGINGAPDGVSTRTVTTRNDNGTILTRDETKTDYGFSIDAELARRFGAFTLRGGVRENTAGVGLDIQPVDRLALSADLFRFQKDAVPNLKGTVTVYPFFNPESNNPLNWIYIQGGVYDALNNNKRDFFAGGGVRFSDREVKGLMGLATGVAGAR